MEVDGETSSSSESDGAGFQEEPKFQLCVGFREDCVRLAALVREKLTVQALFDAWDETRFHRVYMGRRYFTELLEFTEEALIIARDLWLDDTKDIRDQASFFLVAAALYLRQPFCRPERPVRIRLVSKHVDTVSGFIDACDANELHDCVRLLDALFSEGAFDLAAHPRDFGLDQSTLAYLRRDAIGRTQPTVKGPRIRDLPEVSELRSALARYCAAKRGLDNAPNFVTSGRLDALVSKAAEVEQSDGSDEEWTPDKDGAGGGSIATRRQRLKNRAYTKAAVRKESFVEKELKKEKGVEAGEVAPAVDNLQESAAGTSGIQSVPKGTRAMKVREFY